MFLFFLSGVKVEKKQFFVINFFRFIKLNVPKNIITGQFVVSVEKSKTLGRQTNLFNPR